MIIWIQCSKANFRSITDRSVTSRRLRVDRGRLYTPQCCCMIVLFTLGSSVFALSSRRSPSFLLVPINKHHILSPFNPGLIPWRRLSRFLNFRNFSSNPFFSVCRTLVHLGVCIAQQVFRHFQLQPMPRRPPPTPLHLVQGPLPPRGISKFTLPSMPRPIFHPQTMVGQRPVPRERVHSNRIGVAARETGRRVEGGPKSASPCTVGRARVRSVTPPFGMLVKPPKAAGTG